MRNIGSVFGLILLSAVFSASVWSAGPEGPSGTGPENGQKKAVETKKNACDCCKECMAALKPGEQGKGGAPATGGCKDCCDRCGKIEKPVPEKIPPDIIEKK